DGRGGRGHRAERDDPGVVAARRRRRIRGQQLELDPAGVARLRQPGHELVVARLRGAVVRRAVVVAALARARAEAEDEAEAEAEAEDGDIGDRGRAHTTPTRRGGDRLPKYARAVGAGSS